MKKPTSKQIEEVAESLWVIGRRAYDKTAGGYKMQKWSDSNTQNRAAMRSIARWHIQEVGKARNHGCYKTAMEVLRQIATQKRKTREQGLASSTVSFLEQLEIERAITKRRAITPHPDNQSMNQSKGV